MAIIIKTEEEAIMEMEQFTKMSTEPITHMAIPMRLIAGRNIKTEEIIFMAIEPFTKMNMESIKLKVVKRI